MIELESKIDAVCVYREGARVSRKLSIPAQSGLFQVKNLPLCLNDESLSLKLIRPSGAGLLSQVRCQVDLLHKNEQQEASEQKIEALIQQRRLLLEDLMDLKAELAETGKLSYLERQKEKKMSLAKLSQSRLDLAQFKQEQLRQLQEKKFEYEERKEELDKQIHELKEDKKNHLGHEFAKCVSFSLRTELDQGELSLELSYTIPGASWSAAYTLDLQSSGQGHLRMRALINQNTGEDWSQVEVQLSTAALRSWKKLPDLKSLHIGRAQQEQARTQWRAAPSDTDILFFDYDKVFHPEKLRNFGKKKKQSSMARPISAKSFKPAKLIVLSECARGKHTLLDRSPIIVGRDPDCDLCINDETVSSQHARVIYEDGAYYVEDLSSCNGTRINGVRIKGQTLDNSDILQVGGIELLFDSETKGNTTSLTTQTAISLDDIGGGFNPDELRTISGDYCDEDILDVPSRSMVCASKAPGALRAFAQLDGMLSAPIKRKSRPKSTVRKRTQAQVQELAVELFNYSRIGIQTQGLKRGQLEYLSSLNYYASFLSSSSIVDLESSLNSSFEQAAHKVTLPWRHYKPYQKQGFDYLFESDGRVDINSGNEWNAVSVFSTACEAQYSYVACPRETEQVFKVAKLKVSEALLAASVDINMNGIYLLTSELDWSVANQTVEICLGVESQVKLIRKCRYHEKSSGLISQSNELYHSIVNQIQNGLEVEIDLELRERVPLPAKDEKLKVERKVIKPDWSPIKIDDDIQDGLYYWEQKIAAGTSQKFEFSYSIIVTAKEEVCGGNRRDF